MTLRPLAAAALAATALALPACGADATGGAERTEADNRRAELAFARCMRKQGIAMPDPELTPESAAVALPEGVDPNSPAYKKAAAACESLMPKRTT